MTTETASDLKRKDSMPIIKDIAKGLEYLNADYLVNASIIEPIKTGSVDVLYASSECVMAKDKLSDVYMLETNDLTLADDLLKFVSPSDALVAHNERLARFAMERLGFDASVACYQGVYRKEKFADVLSSVEIRLMREDEADEAVKMYHFSPESALRHIKKGLVYGGYIDGTISAMIGMHLQGAMGLLEVKKEYRRRGIAETMEKFLINSLLSKDLVPYCQIVEDNEASLALQRKLGLDISINKLYWLHKDED